MTLRELLEVTELPNWNVEILDYFKTNKDETCVKHDSFIWISKYENDDIYNSNKYLLNKVIFTSIDVNNKCLNVWIKTK